MSEIISVKTPAGGTLKYEGQPAPIVRNRDEAAREREKQRGNGRMASKLEGITREFSSNT